MPLTPASNSGDWWRGPIRDWEDEMIDAQFDTIRITLLVTQKESLEVIKTDSVFEN